MITCQECGADTACTVWVTYEGDGAAGLKLCEACLSEFGEREFVTGVVQTDPADPDQGGKPQQLGVCRECGSVYPTQTTDEGGLRPIGLENGSCHCGNSEFRPVLPT